MWGMANTPTDRIVTPQRQSATDLAKLAAQAKAIADRTARLSPTNAKLDLTIQRAMNEFDRIS
jgi:hypothetical protein